MNLKEKAKALKAQITTIFLALQSKQTPLIAKLVAGITVAYALSPIDLIPDFIPILGYLDDLIVLPLLIALCIKLIPQDVFAACAEQAKDVWKEGKPRKWYFALPIILIWFIATSFILHRWRARHGAMPHAQSFCRR